MKKDHESASKMTSRLSSNKAAAIALTCLFVAAVFLYFSTFNGFHFPDTMKYADTARNFINGHGMASNVINPLGIAKIKYDQRIPADQLRDVYHRYWGYPLILALPYFLFGPSETVTCITSLLLWFLSGFFVFLLAAKFYSIRAGLLAVVLYSLQGTWGALGIAGISESLCSALLLGGGLLILSERRSTLSEFAGGFLGAFSLFIRQQMLFVAPITLVGFILLRKERRFSAATFVLGGMLLFFLAKGAFAPLLFPEPEPFTANIVGQVEPSAKSEAENGSWLGDRLKRTFGSGLLVFSPQYPGHTVARSADVPPIDSRQVLSLLWAKIPINLQLLYHKALFRIGSPILLLFFLFTLLIDRRNRNTRVFSFTVIALFLATAAVVLILFVMARYFQMYIPFLLILAGGGMEKIWQWSEGKNENLRRIITVVLVFALSYPWVFGHLTPLLPAEPLLAEQLGAPHQEKVAIGEFLRANTKPGDVVFSDLPWVTAWYANRPSIWAPLDPREVEELAKWVKADFLFLSLEEPQGFQVWRNWLHAYREKKEGTPLADWKLVAAMQGGARPMFLFERPDETADTPPLQESD